MECIAHAEEGLLGFEWRAYRPELHQAHLKPPMALKPVMKRAYQTQSSQAHRGAHGTVKSRMESAGVLEVSASDEFSSYSTQHYSDACVSKLRILNCALYSPLSLVRRVLQGIIAELSLEAVSRLGAQ